MVDAVEHAQQLQAQTMGRDYKASLNSWMQTVYVEFGGRGVGRPQSGRPTYENWEKMVGGEDRPK